MGTDTLCVYCRRRPVHPAWRPFCSERCQLLDLRNWVDERYRVPEDPSSSPARDGEPPDDEAPER